MKNLRNFNIFGAAAVVCVALACGCDDGTVVQEGLTGIELTVTYEVELDQLNVAGAVNDIEAFEPQLVPGTPRPLAAEGESIVILLPESMDGDMVVLSVHGRMGGQRIASGGTQAEVSEGEIVQAALHLGGRAECGDGVVVEFVEACDDGNADDGDGCSRHCFVEAGYYCNNEPDEPSSCEALCGDEACTPGQRCEEEECICDGAPCEGCCDGNECAPGDDDDACGRNGNPCDNCPPGQECVDGVCTSCNAETCATGCCSGSTCISPPEAENCGLDGVACIDCGIGADGCSPRTGECECGGREPCAPGQECVAGSCRCTETSCPTGCCNGTVCEIRTRETCGADGATCVVCDEELSDSCSAEGECMCGGGPACARGQNCVAGACLCDTISCPDGCCTDLGECESPTLETCGTGGAGCVECPAAGSDSCSADGACSCGDSPACGALQSCVGGECVCDAASCAMGCCRDNVCELPSLTTCGIGGADCVACGVTANTCSASGVCECAGGVACDPGQRCVAGTCICDDLSCPTGCCSGTDCMPGTDPLACGSGGGTCEGCPGTESCVDGVCSGCSTSCSGCCSGPVCLSANLDTCGVGGDACVVCDPIAADTCSATGACRCGGGPTCAAGQHCVGGACVCDAVSCPLGCCDGATCESSTLATCGAGGAACTACDTMLADNCSAGDCRCGGSPACSAGQQCLAGACVCNAASCPDGCCNGVVCEARGVDSCGIAGSACVDCSPLRTDQCDATGTCVCGTTGAACLAGQACVDGACVCNSVSCTGCCDGDVCLPGTDDAACGSGAGACFDCAGAGETCTGGACSGCDATSCAAGCCSGATCLPSSFDTCGVLGIGCVACNPDRADSCSATGECQCGSGPPCDPGQICSGGSCSCGPATCPAGCCDVTGACLPRDIDSCGTAGAACVACDRVTSDSCSPAGVCRCGASAPCTAGQRCDGGFCVCDDISCPTGCCDGTICETSAFDTCGTDGEICVACDPIRADSCSASGECRCGGGGACDAGQHCVDGGCECDDVSCSTGCCDGDTCESGTDPSACGSGGAECVTCPGTETCDGGACSGCNDTSCPTGCCSGSTCVDPPTLGACGFGGEVCDACPADRADDCSAVGSCECGGGTVCAEGQSCVGGICICDVLSCPAGCCDGDICRTASVTECGIGGDACVACDDFIADNCSATGECRCGSTPECGPALHCVGSSCICDADSCAAGCCDAGVCTTSSFATCGIDGASCVACDTETADDCIDGACRCGTGPECDPGQRCDTGDCVCDTTSCPGCCQGDRCLPGTANNRCGLGGVACENCGAVSMTCVAGSCV